jgi:hypothetical protein
MFAVFNPGRAGCNGLVAHRVDADGKQHAAPHASRLAGESSMSATSEGVGHRRSQKLDLAVQCQRRLI